MKFNKRASLFRGLAAITALLFALSTVGYSIAMSNIAVGMVDSFFGVDRTIYNDWTEEVEGYTIPGSVEGYSYLKGVSYETDHATVEEYVDALKAHIIKQGEEGFALLKNDNAALPLAEGAKVALFGWNAYNNPSGHTGGPAGNADKITLAQGLAAAGLDVNATIQAADFSEIGITTDSRGREVESDIHAMKSASADYTIPEMFAPKDTWSIDKDTTTGIVVLGRGGGEGANYIPDSATNAEDPLALSDAEKEMIKYAKENCSKVIVLVVTANAMELGPIAKGGELEVDAIGFCGIPNDYQYQGIANVLAGKVNATGALTDTFAYDNSFNPAVINMGQQQYADLDTIANFADPLERGLEANSYSANNYIVEAEGIYVGYKYYESRYFDSIANPDSNAKDPIGSSKAGEAWDYANEVVFTFGHGLSYVPYSQEIKDVYVDLSENGDITAVIAVTNEGDKDATFLAQLYVSKPYTDYDKEHKVEKAAIDFLSSGKVAVKAGQTELVEISLPTRYLASWDSTALNGAGTYVLDEGNYYFTAAAGAHEAANSVLKTLGFTTDGTTKENAVVTWNELEKFDDSTFSVSNGYEVRNQMQNADINYYLGEGTVTYLSRSDYKATFPKNYTNYTNGSGIAPEPAFTIKGAARETEWLTELVNAQYVLKEAPEAEWAKIEATLPENVGEGKQFSTVWEYIMNVAITKPEAFNNILSDEWQAVANAIRLDVAIASVGAGGHATKEFPGIGNPGSVQSESVFGYSQNLKIAEDKTMRLSVCSNTLLAASFNPALAYEWGRLEGEGGLWLQKTASPNEYSTNAVTVWGGGLNQHRHPYNGRNSEYMSEDPMLTNRIGEAQYRGSGEMGAINGPKHMGFNDQELNRVGNGAYMTEQKVRETDTRCYESALRAHEGGATGVMMSFARIGATNPTNSVGYINNIMRKEWGFTGIISTDMGRAAYHEGGSMIMASVNEYASMRGGDFFMGTAESYDEAATAPNTRANLTLEVAKKDPAFAAQARMTALYTLYTIAHSGSGLYVKEVENVGKDVVVEGYTIQHHDPTGAQIEHADWENIFIVLQYVFGILTAILALGYVITVFVPGKEEN